MVLAAYRRTTLAGCLSTYAAFDGNKLEKSTLRVFAPRPYRVCSIGDRARHRSRAARYGCALRNGHYFSRLGPGLPDLFTQGAAGALPLRLRMNLALRPKTPGGSRSDLLFFSFHAA